MPAISPSASLSPASFNRHLACLVHMLRYGKDMKKVGDEVLLDMVKIKKEEEDGRERILRGKEPENYFKALFKSSSIDYIHAVMLASLTGYRKKEILERKLTEIELFSETVNRDGKDVVIERVSIFLPRKKSKSKKKPRKAILGALGAAIVRARKEAYRRAGYEATYLFENTATGEPFKGFRSAHETTLKAAKIKNFHFHDLRHCMGTMLAALQYNSRTIQKVLGHSSLEMTEVYTNLEDTTLSEAYLAVEAVVTKQLPEGARLH